MKKILYLIMLLFIINNVRADVVIPDGYFKLFLKNKFPSCFYIDANSVEWMNTACSAITSEDSLDLSNFGYNSYPFNLEGIQYFTSLKYLDVHDHGIELSPVLPASLIYANFSNTAPWTPFAPFPSEIFPNTLRHLECTNNYATIYSWPDSLHYLNCSNNVMSQLPALPSHLDTLLCFSQEGASPATNVMHSLPALPATLKYLDCSSNALYSLPALPASLKYLDCSNQFIRTNPENFDWTLATLPALPDGLEVLNCSNNTLTALPALPVSLRELDCSRNRKFQAELTYNVSTNPVVYQGIDILPALPASLEKLSCSYNKLTSLPALPASLKYLDCYNNVYPGYDPTNYNPYPVTSGITSLPTLPPQLISLGCDRTLISCIPRIPASLTSLSVNQTNVHCLPNSGNYSSPLPLCSIFNNSNQCPSTSIISGNVFYDLNSNNVKDPGENYRANVHVNLSNGMNGYTNSYGYYELSADPGTYTLSVDAPSLYAAVPSAINYTVNSYDSIIHDNIALQPTVLRDSITVSVVPLNTPRPGIYYTYRIKYENVGTTMLSPFIVFNYDAGNLSYIYSSNAAVVNNGTSLSLNQTNIGPGQVNMFTVEFEVHTTAQLGDTLRGHLIISAGSCTASDSCYSVVVNSFDPNDKNATPSLTPQQVAGGIFINYIIRFQNTGTASAINVVVTDTLSSFLDAGSFKMIDASHQCKTTRIDNKISFEFFNIMLPDSNVNEAGSHGFIRFAVKPLTGVSLNTVIPNRASIYFDFNQPVLTNIANTTIQLATVPLTLLSFKALPGANNNALLYWNTAYEFNTSLFDIEESLDARTFYRIGSISARGRGDNTYSYKTFIPADIVYYRLKMIDIDGRFTYSQVIQVKRNKQAESITVLSNPAKNTLSIITTDATLINTTATIISELGIVVKRFILKDGLQDINISNLSTGVYYLRTTITTKKIMIYH